MAIPPILSSLPVLKLFKSGSDNTAAQNKTDSAQSRSAKPSQDVVELSEAAKQRLNGVKEPENVEEARNMAADTRAQLSASDRALGLDPDFEA